MQGTLAVGVLVCTMLSGCVQPADYWARLCGDVAQGEDFVPSGKSLVERAVVLHLGDTVTMWPDMTRYPQCAFPVALEFADDVELNEFDKLKMRGPGAISPVSVSGGGEWKQIQWGDVGIRKLSAFAVAAPKVEGPAEISDEARKTEVFVRPE
jgi:hypothetical protein